MADDTQVIAWLRQLAERGGKGVVDNIDARCLGRIADRLEALAAHHHAMTDWKAQAREALRRGAAAGKPPPTCSCCDFTKRPGRGCVGLCEDAVDFVAAALERAAAAERAKWVKVYGDGDDTMLFCGRHPYHGDPDECDCNAVTGCKDAAAIRARAKGGDNG